MGCETITHTDGKKYFIPDCWGAVTHGKDGCYCYTHKKKKLNTDEMVAVLKKENKELKQRIKELEYEKRRV